MRVFLLILALGVSGRAACSITTATPLPDGVKGVSYSQTITSTCTAPVTWSAGPGLPVGVSLDPATGVLSGISASSGSFSFRLQATGADTVSATQTFALFFACQILTASLPSAPIGSPYSQVVNHNCTSPSWSISVGSLPTGMSIDSSTGIISGTPTALGSSSFTVQAFQVLPGDTEVVTQNLTISVGLGGVVWGSGLRLRGLLIH